jgi:hypothetical protein
MVIGATMVVNAYGWPVGILRNYYAALGKRFRQMLSSPMVLPIP